MFKSSFGRGLVAAMESAENTPAVDEIIPAADSAETSLLETAEAGAEVAGTLDDIESAQADSDSLGAIAETMEATEETGGLDPVAAEVAEVAVESICNRLGVARRKYALESFGSKDKRVAATRYAVEEIKDVLKRIWDAIVAAFGKVKEFLKNFFKALFDSNEKLAQRADALINKATNVNGTPKEKEIAAGGFGKALAYGGSFSKAAVISGVQAAPAWLGSVTKSIEKKPEFASQLKELVVDKAKFDNFSLPAWSFDGMKAAGKTEGNIGTFVSSKELRGGREFRVQANTTALKGSEAFTAIGSMKAELAAAENAKSFDGEKVEALTAEEILKVATAAGNLSKAVIEVRKVQETLTKEIDTLQKDAKSAAGAVPKDDAAGASERSKLLARALAASLQFQIRMITTATKYSTDVAKAGLDYAERSLSNIKEEEAAK